MRKQKSRFYIDALHCPTKEKCTRAERRKTLSSSMFISSSPSAIIIYITLQKKKCAVEQRESTMKRVFWTLLSLYTVFMCHTCFLRLRIRAPRETYSYHEPPSTEVGPLLTAAEKSGCLLELDTYWMLLRVRRSASYPPWKGDCEIFAGYPAGIRALWEAYINAFAMPLTGARDRRLSTSR